MKIQDIILTESAIARQLEQMFEPVIKAVEIYDNSNVRLFEDVVRKDIQWIRNTFPDRRGMIWAAHYLRARLLSQLIDDNDTSLEVEEIYNKVKDKLSRFVGKNISDVEIELGFNKVEIAHYLSLPIPEIQDYDYEGKPAPKVIHDFRELEQEWQEEREGQIHYDDEPVLIDFGDGFAWYDLEDAKCDIEGGAMGHCGNAPTANPDETIFSLRKEMDREPDGTVILKPFLTFIFDKRTGMFGEMKGRGNQKPAERYHKYIVPLLRERYVKGIKGGGYLPENNFSILDLSNWQQLYQEKPALLPPQDYYREFGVDDFLISQATFQNVDEDYPETIVCHNVDVDFGSDAIEYNFLRSENAVELFMSHRQVISFVVKYLLNSSQQNNFIERMREESENRIDVDPINDLKDAIDFFDYDSQYNIGIFKHDILPLLEREHHNLLSKTADAVFDVEYNPLNISLMELSIGAEDSIGEESSLMELPLNVPISGGAVPSFEYDSGTGQFSVEFSKKFIISKLMELSDVGIQQIFIDDIMKFSANMDSAGIMIVITDEFKDVVADQLGSEIAGIMVREMNL